MATHRICSIPGCGKPFYARGWCPAHYQRWRNHGDPLADKPLGTLGKREERTCAVADCDKPALIREWCQVHYGRWQRHGDPLGGSTTPGEPKRYFEKVVLSYDGNECLIWPYAKARGYGVLRIDGTLQYVSRIVCLKRHGAPPEPHYVAAHTCGKGQDGCVTPKHISWKTPEENEADKIIHGTSPRGTHAAHAAKLTAANVLEIRRLNNALPRIEIARRFGVSKETIRAILIGKTWGWL